MFECFDAYRALCSYCVILDWEVFGGGLYLAVSRVAALSFKPGCDNGTAIALLQKLRARVIEPNNKDYYQKVVISSFHS